MTEILLNIADILRELCFFYSTFGFIASLNGNTLPVPVSFVITFIVALLCLFLKDKRTLGYVPILGLLALIFPGFTFAKFVTAVPLAVFYAIKTRDNTWHADYDNTQRMLTPGFALFGVTVFISLIFVQGKGPMLRSTAMPVFFLFAVLTVFELRLLRNDAVKNFGNTYILMNFGVLLAIILVVLLLGSPAALHIFTTALRWFYDTLIVPVLMVILYATMIIPYAAYYLFRFLKPDGFENSVEMPRITSIIQEMMPEFESNYTESVWFSRILNALAIIAVLAVMIFVLRRMADRNRYRSAGSASYSRESLAPSGTGKRRKSIFRLNDPDEEVRAAYRSYLSLCEKAGIAVDGSIASDEICRITEGKIHTGDAGELRDLWLPVRFSASADDTGASRAKELLKSLRRSFRELKD